MSDRFDPIPAAETLAEASRSGQRLQALPEAIRPRTLAEGYDVQDRLIERLGDSVAGWKLGVGSHKGKRESGIGRAIAGRILSRRVHQPGDAIPLPHDGLVTVEFEIAYVLGRNVGSGEVVADPQSVVAETRVAFELVLSRFVDRRVVGWPSFAADNAAFEALVLGPDIDGTAIARVAETLVVEADGVEKALIATGEDEVVPANGLADLLAIARDRGMVLPRGSIVSTGTISVPFNLTAAAQITARYLDRDLHFSITRP